MKYAYRDILCSLTDEKKKQDGTLTRLLYRPLSYPLAWLFLSAGWSANAVTALGALCCAIAFLFVLTPLYSLHIAAAGLFLAFAVLDCADGNMARTIGKKTRYGGWADAVAGYFAYAAEIAALGFSCWYFPSDRFDYFPEYLLLWGPETWLILGGAAACANILMRLFYRLKKIRNTLRDCSRHQARKNDSARKSVSQATFPCSILPDCFQIVSLRCL